jgi:N-methylhydantoinase A
VERGHDPSLFTLVAGGGAGPLHGVEVARLLGCKQVYIPRLSGAFCALGMLNSNVQHEYFRVYFDSLVTADLKDIKSILTQLKVEGVNMLLDEGFKKNKMQFFTGYDLRYRGQQWDVTIVIDGNGLNKKIIKSKFESEHQRLFGHIQPDGIIEITKIKLISVGKVKSIPHLYFNESDILAKPKEVRKIWLDPKNKWKETPVYEGFQLKSGNNILGPALINEYTSTILLGEGDQLNIDKSGNYMITVAVK